MITLKEAADLTGIPYQTLYSAISTGRLAYEQVGGNVMVRIENVERYAELYRPRDIFQREQNSHVLR